MTPEEQVHLSRSIFVDIQGHLSRSPFIIWRSYVKPCLSFKLFNCVKTQVYQLNTYKLFFLVCREPCHLLFVGLHLLFIILEVSHYKPKTRQAEMKHETPTEALSGFYMWLIFEIEILRFFWAKLVQTKWNISHLFSLALCLKSSTAFMNRVTL